MKKLLYLFIALVVFSLSSCQNEDIPISREVTFSLNPYSVVSEFVKHEYNVGDLETLIPGDKLRINLFVYDEKGNLVDSAIEFLKDYRQTMSAKIELADGNYTIVAISSCVESDYSEYWMLSDYNRLSSLRLVRNEKYWHGQWEILGISNKRITVGPNNALVNVDIEPAGSLVLNRLKDIHQYSNVYYYQLFGEMDDISYTFNNNGEYSCNYVSSAYYPQQLSSQWAPTDYSSNGVRGYSFLVPTGYTKFRWEAMFEESDGETYYGPIVDNKTLDVKAGAIYEFVFEVSTLNFTLTELRDGEKSMSLFDEENAANTENTCSKSNQ